MKEPALRALAFAGGIFLPLLWLSFLGASAELQTANYFRVLGAVVAAGAGWMLQAVRGGAPSWKSCLAGGVAGSLGVTVLSVFVPAFGSFAVSGWLTSGVVGGGMVALILYGVKGSFSVESASGSKADDPR